MLIAESAMAMKSSATALKITENAKLWIIRISAENSSDFVKDEPRINFLVVCLKSIIFGRFANDIIPVSKKFHER